MVGLVGREVGSPVTAARRHGDRPRAVDSPDLDVARRIAHDDGLPGLEPVPEAHERSRQGDGQQTGTLVRVVAVRAHGEEAPEVEPLELAARARLDVPREQPLARVAAQGERFESGRDPRQWTEPRPLGRRGQLAPEQLDVASQHRSSSLEEARGREAAATKDLLADPGIGASVHADLGRRFSPAEELEERAVDRAPAGAGGLDQRAVDVPQDEASHGARVLTRPRGSGKSGAHGSALRVQPSADGVATWYHQFPRCWTASTMRTGVPCAAVATWVTPAAS